MYSKEQETEIENNANRHLGKKKLASCYNRKLLPGSESMIAGFEFQSEVDRKILLSDEILHKSFWYCKTESCQRVGKTIFQKWKLPIQMFLKE